MIKFQIIYLSSIQSDLKLNVYSLLNKTMT